MDQQIKKSQIKLEELFKEVASLGNISEEQKKELLTKLEGAIILNIVGKLLDELQETDKKLIEQQGFKNNEDLFKFLSSAVSQENFYKVVTLSVEEVVKKFLEKI